MKKRNIINMSNETFSVLVYPLLYRKNNEGTVPLFLRITVNGKRKEVSLNRRVQLSLWNENQEKAKGSSEEIKILNNYIQLKKNEVFQQYNLMVSEGKEITADSLRDRLNSRNINNYTLMQVYEKKQKEVIALLGKGYSSNTLKHYETGRRKLVEFLKTLNKSDILMIDLDLSFIEKFNLFLRQTRNNNSAVRLHKTIKIIMRYAINHNYLKKSPYDNFKLRNDEVIREVLTENELNLISKKVIQIERLACVRDIFLFSCYTGISYVDIYGLTEKNIVVGVDNNLWLSFTRQKTNQIVKVPLLYPALIIIENYKDHPVCNCKGKLLPVLTNQKMNSYLKELADICAIDKNLTFHLARHTFATTITLSKGVPMETVSKMLGHRSLKTTQIYSKVVDMKVLNDMDRLKPFYN